MKVETASIKISMHTLGKVKRFVKNKKSLKKFTIGGFCDQAINEKLLKETFTEIPKD